jgi:hypothetical protein
MSLDESAVASRVAMVADRAGYPGLLREYKSLCSELDLPSPAKTSKLTWKQLVKKAIFEKNKKLGEFTMVSQPIRLILVDWFIFHFCLGRLPFLFSSFF